LGFGRNVTGFRSWLNYALCFGVLVFLGRFLGGRQNLLKLARSLVLVSLALSVLLIAAALSMSFTVASVLTYLGMYVTYFDNGILRFVVLPGFGLILLSLAMLPHLLKLKPLARWTLGIIGAGAIIVGGNRSSLGGAVIISLIIPLLRRKYLLAGTVTGAILAAAVGGYFAGAILSRLPQTGLYRAFALVSPALSRATGGDSNLEWREARWQRALEEIHKHPLIGEGYGGLENAFEITDAAQMEETSQEMSLATGGVHNGYLASALALGIPASLFFICILVGNIFSNANRAFTLQKKDPVLGEAHCFVCANLLAYSAGIFIGTDLNDPMIWFYFALGLFLIRLQVRERKQAMAGQSAKAAPAFVDRVLVNQIA
jgi:O-antigen ligase